MRLQTWLILIGAFVAVLAASALFHERTEESRDPLALQIDGIGPLALGLDYDTAKAVARHAAPDAFLAGPGCGDRDEITYSGHLGPLPVTVMAMADDGVITEVELSLEHPRQAEDEANCLAQRERLAGFFEDRFGPAGESWVDRKPVSTEHRTQVGPAVLVARWFSTGRSCYVSAVYGGSAAGVVAQRLGVSEVQY